MTHGIDREHQRITGGPGDLFVDEIVLCGVDIHFERMHDGLMWVGIYRPDSETRLMVNLWAVKKDLIAVSATWDGSGDVQSWPGVKHQVRTFGDQWPDGVPR